MLGIWVDGLVGIGFEIMALIVFSFGKNITVLNFSKQCSYIIIIEVLIDVLCGEISMLVEAGVWVGQQTIQLVSNLIWFLPILLILKTNNSTPRLSIPFSDRKCAISHNFKKNQFYNSLISNRLSFGTSIEILKSNYSKLMIQYNG